MNPACCKNLSATLQRVDAAIIHSNNFDDDDDDEVDAGGGGGVSLHGVDVKTTFIICDIFIISNKKYLQQNQKTIKET